VGGAVLHCAVLHNADWFITISHRAQAQFSDYPQTAKLFLAIHLRGGGSFATMVADLFAREDHLEAGNLSPC